MDETRIKVVRARTGDRMVEVYGRADLSDCEDLVEAMPTFSGSTRVKVATGWGLDARPGGAAAAMQALITWARSQEEPTLVTHARPNAPTEVLERFCERAQGICAVMMSANVVAVDGTTDVKHEAWRCVQGQVAAMDRMDVSAVLRGQTLSLVCVDHSSLGALTPLYRRAGEGIQVRDASELRDLLDDVLAAISPRHGGKVSPLTEDLGIILHELLANTHHHGRVDVRGDFYKRSVRSVILSERAVPTNALERRSEGWTGMSDYLELVARSSRSRHNARFIELSVIDSGPGMAAHAAKAELDLRMALADEQALVQKCFGKNETRRTKAGLGMGLSRVMNVVKAAGGLIRVRTGRLALTKFFDPATAEPGAAPTEAETTLVDSRTLSPVASARGKAAGTAVTVLIPIGLDRG